MRLRDSIHRVNHEGVENRKRGRLRRRTFNAPTMFKVPLLKWAILVAELELKRPWKMSPTQHYLDPPLLSL